MTLGNIIHIATTKRYGTTNTGQIHYFLRRFRLQGGLLRRLQIHNHSARNSTGEMRLIVREGEHQNPTRLKFVFEGVEELLSAQARTWVIAVKGSSPGTFQ